MKVAIIGAGRVGRALAGAAVSAGHDVVLAARTLSSARTALDHVSGATIASSRDAAEDADVILLAVPYAAVPDVAAQLGDTVVGKVVIDVTNPLRADRTGLAVTERAGAEEVQASLPGAHVVKALNTVFCTRQASPRVDGIVLDGFYAGDDPAAKELVRGLLEQMGYRPIDAGSLDAALELEHMAFLNISLNAAHGWPWQSGWKLVGPTG